MGLPYLKGAYILWIFVKTECHELLEELGEVALELRGVALRDEKEDSHGVEVSVGWFPLGQLDGRDAQGPDISLKWKRQESSNRSFFRTVSLGHSPQFSDQDTGMSLGQSPPPHWTIFFRTLFSVLTSH